MIKFPQSEFARLLWSVNNGVVLPKRRHNSASVGFLQDKKIPMSAYNAMGFVVLGTWVLRADMAERLGASLEKRARSGPFALDSALYSLAGCDKKRFIKIIKILGYGTLENERRNTNERLYVIKPIHKNKKVKKTKKIDPNSPFAELGRHSIFLDDPKE